MHNWIWVTSGQYLLFSSFFVFCLNGRVSGSISRLAEQQSTTTSKNVGRSTMVGHVVSGDNVCH